MNMNKIGEQTREFYRRQGELRERERIIKLLETDKAEREPVCSDADCEKCWAFKIGFNRAVYLINGEIK